MLTWVLNSLLVLPGDSSDLSCLQNIYFHLIMKHAVKYLIIKPINLLIFH